MCKIANKRIRFIIISLILLILVFFSVSSVNAATKELSKPQITSAKYMGSTNSINLKWKKVKNAKKYEIYVSENGGEYSKIKTTSKTSYKDKDINNTGTYKYKIKAVNGKVKSKFSNTKKVSVKLDKPVISSIKYNQKKNIITIKWGKVKYAKQYEIYISTDGGDFYSLDTSEKLSYKMEPLDDVKSFKFKIKAKNGAIESNFSKTKKITPKRIELSMPEVFFVAHSDYSDSIEIVWEKVKNAKEYEIYYADEAASTNFDYKLIGTTSKNYYSHYGIKKDESAYYYIVAVYGNNRSEMSDLIYYKPIDISTQTTPLYFQLNSYSFAEDKITEIICDPTINYSDPSTNFRNISVKVQINIERIDISSMGWSKHSYWYRLYKDDVIIKEYTMSPDNWDDIVSGETYILTEEFDFDTEYYDNSFYRLEISDTWSGHRDI